MQNIPHKTSFAIDRQGLLSALSNSINQQRNRQKLTVLALVDLKNFAQVNQRFGFSNGDRVLAELQQRLTAIPQNPIFCTRVDGDKFALIFSPLLNIQLIPLVAKKIVDQLSRLFILDDQSIFLEGHIGFSASSSGIKAEELLQEAEAAAKQAQSCQQQYHISESSAVESARHQVRLKQQVIKGLSESSFQLHYQPQISLSNNQPRGAESLIRWLDNNDYRVKPEQLIAIVEQSGHMQDLFLWTVNTALRESANWCSHGKPITTAVNLSASCLRWPGLFDSIESSLNLWGGNPANLCIEVTESTIQQDLNQGFKTLSRIKQLGVKISIDDFGTGYSSLEYFKFIPADELKIDKSFIFNMLNSQIDMDIVKLILDWGMRFNMEIVAEGVEDQECLNTLAELGCTYAQGYHISKAMPAEKFHKWLEKYQTDTSKKTFNKKTING
jgi:diguanylate cyclase (GGDEF)-like protein